MIILILKDFCFISSSQQTKTQRPVMYRLGDYYCHQIHILTAMICLFTWYVKIFIDTHYLYYAQTISLSNYHASGCMLENPKI